MAEAGHYKGGRLMGRSLPLLLRRATQTGVRITSIDVPVWTCALLVLAVTWVSWQNVAFVGTAGLDPSWQAGLAMATHQGLSFGHDTVFTYGPLGFLSVTPIDWVDSLTLPSFVYLVLERVAVAGALLFGVRQTFGRTLGATVVAALLAGLLASLIDMHLETSALMVLAGWALRRGVEGRRAQALAVAFGVIAAIELLNKVSNGVTCMLMAAALLLVLPERRRWSLLLIGAASGVVVFFALWFGLSQPIGALPAYIAGIEQISGGYAEAMSVVIPADNWVATYGLVMLLAGVWAAWHSTEGRPTRYRLGLGMVWVVFWFFSFKELVVGYETQLFAEQMIVAWCAFGPSLRARRSESLWRLLGGLALGLCILIAVRGEGSLTATIHPRLAVSDAVSNLRTAFSPRRRGVAIAATRAAVWATEAVDPRTIAQLRGHTMSVFGPEIDVAWAYALDWDPIPVLQSYAAYTPYLDRLDARFLSSSRAPDRILLGTTGTTPNESISDRVLGFDEPATTRAMLCRYTTMSVHGNWAVLARTANRCSTSERLLGVQRVAWGQPVAIPAPPSAHSIVLARVSGTHVSGLETLGSFFFKPAIREVGLDGVGHRFVSANEGDGLALRSGSGFDVPGPFALVPQSHTISFTRAGQPTGGQPITIRFYAQNYH